MFGTFSCSQLYVLREIMKDIGLGERHVLLIGNQGTGKNKLGMFKISQGLGGGQHRPRYLAME
jgi:predicted transcriptional regulator